MTGLGFVQKLVPDGVVSGLRLPRQALGCVRHGFMDGGDLDANRGCEVGG